MEHHRSFRVETRDFLTWATGCGLDPSKRTERGYMIWFLLVRPFAGVLQYDAFQSTLLNRSWKKPRFRRAVLICRAAILSSLVVACRLEWILWYWFIPYFTVYQVLFFWDDMIGHYNCPRTGTPVMRGLWFRIMAIHATAYHNIHHQYAKIPWLNQKRATVLFMKEDSMDVARGFMDAIQQMVTAHE